MIVTSLILALLLTTYCFCVLGMGLSFYCGKRKKRSSTSGTSPFISIVIAVRNEEKDLPIVIRSIQNQNYARDKFELIVVNDHSEDKTAELLSTIAHEYEGMVVLNSPIGKIGKKAAIDEGVRVAKGEIIVSTDADCRMDIEWLTAIADRFSDNDLQLLVGPVTFEKRFRYNILFPEQLALQMISGGSANSGNALLASAANLAYRRALFIRHNGFEGDYFVSGDDLRLLEMAKNESRNAVQFLTDHKGIVFTKAENTIRGMIGQRARWMSKTKAMGGQKMRFYGVVILLANLLPILCMTAFFIGEDVFFILFSGWLIKSVIDLLLLSLSVPFFREPTVLITLPLAEIFYPFVSILSIVKSIFGRIVWKGRNWKR